MTRRRERPPSGRAAGADAAASRARLPDDIFSHVTALEPGLSRSHKIVARAVLAHPRTMIEKPIEELVPWLGVSAPTITRFARAVGCDGLRDLKLKMMVGLRVGLRYLEPLTPPDDAAEVVTRVVQRAQHAMATAVQTLDLARVQQAAGILRAARTLYVFGGGGVSSWLVVEVQNRLFRLGVCTIPSSDHLMQMMLAATMRPGDALLCCSLTGRNPELLRAAAIARQYGATVLALTAGGSPLAAAVELPLTLTLNDDRDVLGPTALRYGYLVAVDVLSYLVGLQDSRSAQETLRRIKQQFVLHLDKDDSQPLSD